MKLRVPVLPANQSPDEGPQASPMWIDESSGQLKIKIGGTTSTLALGASTTTSAIQWFDAAPVAETVTVVLRAPFAFTVQTLAAKTGAGTVTINAKIDNTSITGLSAVAASTTESISTASAANSVAVGNDLNITYTSPSACSNLSCTFTITR